jgi:hypothetical protein
MLDFLYLFGLAAFAALSFGLVVLCEYLMGGSR